MMSAYLTLLYEINTDSEIGLPWNFSLILIFTVFFYVSEKSLDYLKLMVKKSQFYNFKMPCKPLWKRLLVTFI